MINMPKNADSRESANTPRPKRENIAGEIVLKKYAAADAYVGLHFEQYDDFIFSPVIKDDILNANPTNKEHITVYLSHYADDTVAKALKKIKEIRFEVFSKSVKEITVDGNITFIKCFGAYRNKSNVAVNRYFFHAF